ncbi:hypothetical protein [Paraburkholderia nemoris]|uniref:hypothetical protein n=1 Tax=Paraburkholderia nemoris TaxID=2793076 RepID=UPI001EF1224D|nr:MULTISPECIES: hypothetical protein [Paraburkholderia]
MPERLARSASADIFSRIDRNFRLIVAYIQYIAPTPLMMIVATGDGLTPADLRSWPVIMRDQRMLCVPRDHPFVDAGLLDLELLSQERLVLRTPDDRITHHMMSENPRPSQHRSADL